MPFYSFCFCLFNKGLLGASCVPAPREALERQGSTKSTSLPSRYSQAWSHGAARATECWGHPHRPGPGVRKHLGTKWHVSMTTGWVGVRAGEEEREGTQGARSRGKRLVSSNLLPPGERERVWRNATFVPFCVKHGSWACVNCGGKGIGPYNREVGRTLKSFLLRILSFF